MKFLCDRMLGTLAKWLRIYGFDTFYANSGLDDSDLINISKKENRIFITRDKNLVFKARRENITVIQIDSTIIDDQLLMVLKDIKIDNDLFLTRCLLCNSIIKDIKKEKVRDKVPERVFRSNDKFWFCNKCKKIYWKGSHYEKMLEKINFIKK